MARDGDLEKGWKRLLGLSSSRVPAFPDAVEAAAFCTRDWLAGVIGCDCDGATRLSGSCVPVGKLRSLPLLPRECELKLRTENAGVLLQPRLELVQFCGRTTGPRGLTPRRSTWRQRPQVYSPVIVSFVDE